MLQLSCVSQQCIDPEFYCIMATIKAFRDCHSPDLSEHTLQYLVSGGRPSPGPANSLLQCLHKLSWSWHGSGMCFDQYRNPIDLVSCPLRELKQRVQDAWRFRIFAITEETRKTMTGLAQSDATLTQEAMQSLPVDKQGLMRCALNGTQFTNDALVHTSLVESNSCRFCGQPDSSIHRHWYCPHFNHIRDKYTELSMLPETATPALLAHGWLPEPLHKVAYESALDKLPDTTAEFFPVQVSETLIHHDIFTDGSGYRPSDKHLRVATWGCVIWTGNLFQPLSNGGLPGRTQTVLRAEITAAISALAFTALSERPVRIWIDNKQVFDILCALQTGDEVDVSKKADADLWRRLIRQWNVSRSNLVGVLKVQAHADPDLQTCPVDTWAVLGNAAADRCAATARLGLPPSFWVIWETYANEIRATRLLGSALHSMYTDIAHHAQQPTTLDPDLVQPSGIHFDDQAEVDLELSNLAFLTAEQIPKRFQIKVAQPILDWLADVTCPTTDAARQQRREIRHMERKQELVAAKAQRRQLQLSFWRWQLHLQSSKLLLKAESAVALKASLGLLIVLRFCWNSWALLSSHRCSLAEQGQQRKVQGARHLVSTLRRIVASRLREMYVIRRGAQRVEAPWWDFHCTWISRRAQRDKLRVLCHAWHALALKLTRKSHRSSSAMEALEFSAANHVGRWLRMLLRAWKAAKGRGSRRLRRSQIVPAWRCGARGMVPSVFQLWRLHVQQLHEARVTQQRCSQARAEWLKWHEGQLRKLLMLLCFCALRFDALAARARKAQTRLAQVWSEQLQQERLTEETRQQRAARHFEKELGRLKARSFSDGKLHAMQRFELDLPEPVTGTRPTRPTRPEPTAVAAMAIEPVVRPHQGASPPSKLAPKACAARSVVVLDRADRRLVDLLQRRGAIEEALSLHTSRYQAGG
eukprot:s1528_g6.t1